MKLPRKKYNSLGISLIVVLLIVVVVGTLGGVLGANVYFRNFGNTIKNKVSQALNGKPTPLPDPTPTLPPPLNLPTGIQEYTLSHGKDVKGPKPSKVIFNPLSPKVGESLTLSVQVGNDSPVTDASVTLQTDSKAQAYPLKLVSGDATNGTWQTLININDSYLYMYAFRFVFKSSTGTYDNVMRIR